MTVILLMGATLVLLLAAGFPIALVLGTTGVVWTFIYNPNALSGIAHTVFNTSASEALIAVPLFVLMGQMVQHSMVSQRFYQAVAVWLRRVPGGLLHANIAVCSVFSAVNGSSVATAATVASAVATSSPVVTAATGTPAARAKPAVISAVDTRGALPPGT